MISAGYRHEALMYAGDDQFVKRLTPFLRDGARAAEPTLVVVSAPKIDRLRRALGQDAGQVTFADMADIGANPANIIPAWQDFVSAQPGGSRWIRGVGEPITPDRASHDLVERENHEALLNVAFPGSPDFWLVCPYDTVALDPAIVEGAHRNHPFISDGHGHADSPSYLADGMATRVLASPLPEPSREPVSVAFDRASLRALRAAVYTAAARAGMCPRRMADLVLATGELARNSLVHGGGSGLARLWVDGPNFICEVRDGGILADALADRQRPTDHVDAPRGLWLANRLCDLVQVRSLENGTVVRLHQRLA